MAAVSLQKVTKQFGAVHALHNISLEVAAGELVALLGPSGCGKTTLLRTVAGLEQPTQGQIWINGQDVTLVATRHRPIGMVFQQYALFPNMTVRQNIAFPLVVRNVRAAQMKMRVDELLTLVQMTDQADRYPNQLSGGQQQRTALARALAPAPQVLLLDEPLSALDAFVRAQLRDEIRRIQQMVKITMLYVTHDQAEALAIADRVAVMNRGKVEQVAAPMEIYEAPATHFSAAFVGNRNVLELPVQQGRLCLGTALDMKWPDATSLRALVFFRPEDVEISNHETGQLATVESKTFLGSTMRLHLLLEIAGQRVRIYADLPSRRATQLAAGSTVRISINPAGVRVFPLEP